MIKEKDRLSEEALANKRRYNLEYIRNNYVRKSISFPKEEYERYEKLLKKAKMTKIEFVRLAFKLLEEGKIKKED